MSADRPAGAAGAAGRPGMIDWDLAVKVGSRLVGEGPQVSRDEAVEAVEELRAGAERSTPLVREYTGLVASDRTAPVLVVTATADPAAASVEGSGSTVASGG